jgi:hypothetical protein
MSSELSSCALGVLVKLGTEVGVEVLQTLSMLCVTAQTSLQILKAQKQVLLTTIDITLIPQQAKQAVLDKVIANVRGVGQIIPPAISTLCPDLGQVSFKLEQSLEAPLQRALQADWKIKQNLSISAQISDEIDKIDVAINFFKSLNVSIQKAIPTVPN